MKLKLNLNIAVVLVSIIVSILYKSTLLESFDKTRIFTLSIIAFVNVILFWSTSIKITKSWINYNTLFLLGFLIVHFQIPFLSSIGIEPESPSFVWINKQVVNYAVWLSTIALLLWILGYLLYLKKNYKFKFKETIRQSYIVDTKKIDFFLLTLFILFIVLVGKEFLTGNYDGGDNWGVGANYAYLLLRVLIHLRILYFFINTRFIKITGSTIIPLLFKNKIFTIVLIIYFLIFLFSGDRGPVMSIILLFAIGFSLYQRKISLSFFLFSVVIGGLFLTLIGLGRSRDISNRDLGLFEEGYKNLVEKKGGFNPTNELAYSNRILFRALDVVPRQHPYLYGSTFGLEIIGVIPFAGGTFLSLTGLPEMYKSSSYFFTIIGQGKNYTYGEGSEIIGDIYINFGFYGVLILIFALGYFVAFITTRTMTSYNHSFVLIYAILTVGALYINRSHFLDPLKIIIYALVLDHLLAKKIFSYVR